MIIPGMTKEEFRDFFKGLGTAGYWSINSESEKDKYGLLKNLNAIRIAKKAGLVPNIELKFAKDDRDRTSLQDAITVVLKKGKLKIAPLELQIAYKEKILCSEKDLEDATHLLEGFKEELNKELLEKYRIELEK